MLKIPSSSQAAWYPSWLGVLWLTLYTRHCELGLLFSGAATDLLCLVLCESWSLETCCSPASSFIMKNSQDLQFHETGFSFPTPRIALEVFKPCVVTKDSTRHCRIRPHLPTDTHLQGFLKYVEIHLCKVLNGENRSPERAVIHGVIEEQCLHLINCRKSKSGKYSN